MASVPSNEQPPVVVVNTNPSQSQPQVAADTTSRVHLLVLTLGIGAIGAGAFLMAYYQMAHMSYFIAGGALAGSGLLALMGAAICCCRARQPVETAAETAVAEAVAQPVQTPPVAAAHAPFESADASRFSLPPPTPPQLPPLPTGAPQPPPGGPPGKPGSPTPAPVAAPPSPQPAAAAAVPVTPKADAKEPPATPPPSAAQLTGRRVSTAIKNARPLEKQRAFMGAMEQFSLIAASKDKVDFLAGFDEDDMSLSQLMEKVLSPYHHAFMNNNPAKPQQNKPQDLPESVAEAFAQFPRSVAEMFVNYYTQNPSLGDQQGYLRLVRQIEVKMSAEAKQALARDFQRVANTNTKFGAFVA